MDFELEMNWIGDLKDDCTAEWNGLTLRAEKMDKRNWWWCVYDEKNDTIDDSNEHYPNQYKNGKVARAEAERVAKEYLAKAIKVPRVRVD